MGDLDHVAFDAVVAHQQPASQTLVDIISVRQSRLGDLRSEGLDKLLQKSVKSAAARGNVFEGSKLQTMPFSSDLNNDFVWIGSTPADAAVGAKPSRPNIPASALHPSEDTATTEPIPDVRK
jgi:hypothetical protein